MFLPILAALVASMALVKLGTLAVWVAVLALALKLSIAVVFLLAGLLAWNNRMSEALDVSADQAQARFEAIQAMAERTAERMVTLIVVFLMQTLVVPFILLFVLYRLLGGLVLHNRQIAGVKMPIR